MITFKGGEKLLQRYEDNVAAMLRRKGYSSKYDHAGIYCIRLDDRIVYIGKSINMLERIAQHYVGIKNGRKEKYRIMSQLQREGYPISFDVLYDASQTNRYDIDEEIGYMEGVYLRAYRPELNTQIPKEEDWHKYEVKRIATEDELRKLLLSK